MTLPALDAVAAVLLVPLAGAALLAILPGYRSTARLNVLFSLLTLLAALALVLGERPAPGPYLLVDDLNIHARLGGHRGRCDAPQRRSHVQTDPHRRRPPRPRYLGHWPVFHLSAERTASPED